MRKIYENFKIKGSVSAQCQVSLPKIKKLAIAQEN